MSEIVSRESAASYPELIEAEGILQELILYASVDLLGSSTRSYLDKVVISACIGILAGTVGTLSPKPTLGPFVITIAASWALPAAVTAAILFYSFGFIVLAQADWRRWEAGFAIKQVKLVSLARTLDQIVRDEAERFSVFSREIELRSANCEYLDPSTLTDGLPTPLVVRAKLLRELSDSVARIIGSIVRPSRRLRKQAILHLVTFVGFPVFLSVSALSFCTRSLVIALTAR